MNMNIVFLPLARVTFSMPDAESNFKNSCTVLSEVMGEVTSPKELLTSPDKVSGFLDGIQEPDLVIYQCTTFIGGDFVSEITRRFKCPVLIWAVREPSIDGSRLKLNSLTGAFSAGNSLHCQERPFQYIFGNPAEDSVRQELGKIFKTLTVVKRMKSLVIGLVGSQPAGFAFGALAESLLNGKFGIRVVQTETAEIMREAVSYEPGQYAGFLDELKSRAGGWEKLPEENLDKYARLRKAYQDFLERTGVNTVASKCWPDFFIGFGAPVCSILSMLNDNDIPTACEADMGGVISMFIGSGLTGSPTYLGDPVAIDESCDGIVYWHCGAGATTLARKKEGAMIGVHPNRKIGPTMEFGLKEGEVTILRLGFDSKGFRMFAMKGTALDEPQKFYGTSVTVRPKNGHSAAKVARFIKEGWEPHFVVAYGDITDELRLLSELLDIRFTEYE